MLTILLLLCHCFRICLTLINFINLGILLILLLLCRLHSCFCLLNNFFQVFHLFWVEAGCTFAHQLFAKGIHFCIRCLNLVFSTDLKFPLFDASLCFVWVAADLVGGIVSVPADLAAVVLRQAHRPVHLFEGSHEEAVVASCLLQLL